jgi:hypothetical protein
MYVWLFLFLVPSFKTMSAMGFFGHLNIGTGLAGGVTGALSANVVLQTISNKMTSTIFIEIE